MATTLSGFPETYPRGDRSASAVTHQHVRHVPLRGVLDSRLSGSGSPCAFDARGLDGADRTTATSPRSNDFARLMAISRVDGDVGQVESLGSSFSSRLLISFARQINHIAAAVVAAAASDMAQPKLAHDKQNANASRPADKQQESRSIELTSEPQTWFLFRRHVEPTGRESSAQFVKLGTTCSNAAIPMATTVPQSKSASESTMRGNRIARWLSTLPGCPVIYLCGQFRIRG